MTIFSTTQGSNVGTMLQPFETMLQQCCNAVLCIKSSLQIRPVKHHLKTGQSSPEVQNPYSSFILMFYNSGGEKLLRS